MAEIVKRDPSDANWLVATESGFSLIELPVINPELLFIELVKKFIDPASETIPELIEF